MRGVARRFRVKETHSPERKYEEYFEKSIDPPRRPRDTTSSKRTSPSRPRDLSATRQRDGSVRSSPSTVILSCRCGSLGIMAVATSSRLRSIIRFRVSGLSPYPMLSRSLLFSLSPTRSIAEIKARVSVAPSVLDAPNPRLDVKRGAGNVVPPTGATKARSVKFFVLRI